ncbi:hypothetical protein AVEN_206288-1 [Araneus ventricosus]|uniref:Uncharacterized protein n=1 Tax=Araneus ventricosus TaxID=182803 RepID=A0A4Y2V4A3_ARAVE|nr:hypothetical protein AVEN_75955-1 [Araneus ventricosus]GBM28754.1 hypothetical protein AVEN_93685-1 [Araneus ventricosus]GBO18541.1 hypothetical protein AVEN_112801-1 [Araneus ventricosus]GBO18547.1 hypothetical protein AVEN_206288-1 [Araneus ventricosus]
MRNRVGHISVVRSQYRNEPIPAILRINMDKSARALKRITGEWHDLSLHLTGIDNDVFKKLLNEVHDALRDNGYGSSDESTETDSNLDYSVCNEENNGMIINADVNISIPNDFRNCDKSTNDKDLSLMEFTGAKTIFDYAVPNIWYWIKSLYRSSVKRSHTV